MVNQSKMEESKIITLRKSSDANYRKSQIEELERKKKVFYLYKWDFLRQKRQEQEERIKAIVYQRDICTKWLKLRAMAGVVRAIHGKHQEKVAKRDMRLRMMRSSKKISKLFENYLKKKGETQQQRGKHEVRDACTFFIAWQDKALEKQAQNKMLTFLQDAADFYRFKMILKDFHRRMVLIQVGFTERQASMKNRLAYIMNFWDNEKNFLITYNIESRKKNKKAQALNSKLMKQADGIREAMCKLYLLKCYLNFIIKFSIWRIKSKGDIDCEEYHEEIEERTKMMEQIKDYLFLKTETVVKDGIVAASIEKHGSSAEKQGITPAASLATQNYEGFSQALEAYKKENKDEEGKEQEVSHTALKELAGPPPLFIMAPSRETMLRMIVRSTAFAEASEVNFKA